MELLWFSKQQTFHKLIIQSKDGTIFLAKYTRIESWNKIIDKLVHELRPVFFKFLSEVNLIFVDRTLKNCQNCLYNFIQFIAWKIIITYHWCFFLLPSKNIDTYTKTFRYFKSEFIKNNINFSLKIIFSDFEKAINHSSV
jgi:hypothetical protein